jgi:hypothetical protein
MIKCSECGYENIDGDYCDDGARLNAPWRRRARAAAAAAPEAATAPARNQPTDPRRGSRYTASV